MSTIRANATAPSLAVSPLASQKSAELRAEGQAIHSSCCGFLGEVTLTDSAVMILFATALGAGDLFTMLTTALLPLLNGLCVLPFSWLSRRLGSKTLVLWSTALAAIAYFSAVAAPFSGKSAPVTLVLSIFLFSLFQAGFIAGWFPLLGTFLSPERRIGFFGRMRLRHQLCGTGFILLAGLSLGSHPGIQHLQLVLFISALIFVGRFIFVARIPQFPLSRSRQFSFVGGIAVTLRNRPLLSFSIYAFFINLASYATIPLTILYLKNEIHAPDNTIIVLSALALSGMILGYALTSRLVSRLGIRGMILALHSAFFLLNVGFCCVRGPDWSCYLQIGALLTVYNFAIASFSIITSGEAMSLAAHRNRTVDLAASGALTYSGLGLSRVLASFALGGGALSSCWQLGDWAVTRYQTLYGVFALLFLVSAMMLPLVPAVIPGKKRKGGRAR